MSVITTTGGTQQDSCFIHPSDIKGLSPDSSAPNLLDFSVTELLGIDNWLWLEHDGCFCRHKASRNRRKVMVSVC